MTQTTSFGGTQAEYLNPKLYTQKNAGMFEKLPVSCAISTLRRGLVVSFGCQPWPAGTNESKCWFEWPRTNWSNYNSATNESSLFSPKRRQLLDQLDSADVAQLAVWLWRVANLLIHILTPCGRVVQSASEWKMADVTSILRAGRAWELHQHGALMPSNCTVAIPTYYIHM